MRSSTRSSTSFGWTLVQPWDEDLPVANIGGHHDASGKVGTHIDQPVEVFQRTCPDDDALSTITEEPVDRFPAPDSSSDLHFDVGGAKDCLNLRRVVAASRYSIEVDDVQVAKSVLSPR